MLAMSLESNAHAHVEDFTWHQGNPGMSDDEARLRDAVALLTEAEDLVAQRAHEAHERGMSWEQVGEITGYSRMSASKRYSWPRLKGYRKTD